jgi:hypothetical protein
MLYNNGKGSFRRRTAQALEHFADRHYEFYVFLIWVLALIGYAYLFAFPYGLYQGGVYLMHAVPRAASADDWGRVGAVISIMLLCLVTCLHIIRMRGLQPRGIPLRREHAPQLFKLVQATARQYHHPAIHRVLLSDDYQLQLRHIPVCGFPCRFSPTLVIGLPLLQTLSPSHFRCELTRRIAQHSRRRLQPGYHVLRTQQLWQGYTEVLTTQPRFGDQLLRWFLGLYSPLFDLLSLPVRRRDELTADSKALEYVNDKDVFEAVKAGAISALFLTRHYWPRVRRLALKDGVTELAPFTKLDQLACPLLRQIDGRKWLQELRAGEPDPTSPLPDLQHRMHNMGQGKLREAPTVITPAAALYFQESHAPLVQAVDALWQATTLRAWRRAYERKRADIAAIQALSEKSHGRPLRLKEIWRYARLAKRLQGKPRRRSMAKLLRRNLSHFGKAQAGPDADHGRLEDVF